MLWRVGFDGLVCWSEICGNREVWFARGPNGALLGPYLSYDECVAAQRRAVEAEKVANEEERRRRERGKLVDQLLQNALVQDENLEISYAKVALVLNGWEIWSALVGPSKIFFIMRSSGPVKGLHSPNEEQIRIKIYELSQPKPDADSFGPV